MNDTTFQEDGKVAYVPAVVNAKLTKPSRADRIRAMSDEELAIEMTAKGGCPHDCEEPENMETDCVKCWLDWLKEEVESNDS